MKKIEMRRFRISYVLYLVSLLLILTTNCTKDSDVEEIQNNTQLKNYYTGEKLEYTGKIDDAEIEIIIPAAENWNGIFIVYAHGYVDPIASIALPNDSIRLNESEFVKIKDYITASNTDGKNFAYASTSYSENGFAVKEAVEDIEALGNKIKELYSPYKIILAGASEGGLVALKMLETEDQDIFDAGLVSCAPIGDFKAQVEYFGDFHVLFNYLFDNELKWISNYLGIEALDIGNPAGVPEDIIYQWFDTNTKEQFAFAFSQAMETMLSYWKIPILFDYANVPYLDYIIENPDIIEDSDFLNNCFQVMYEILRFNIMATNDIIDRVGGVPYDNVSKVYSCSLSPDNLPEYITNNYDLPAEVLTRIINAINSNINAGIERIEGSSEAIDELDNLYETSGSPNIPVLFMHTKYDHITPFDIHIPAYINKFVGTPSIDYLPTNENPGHCTLTVADITEQLTILMGLITN